ncbi:MASE1 domain-containing protein [Dyella caseinilytica]|uniref:MASE1 domain-containing protein n=1 Tax=Dyella caseinilytica TaxID=1849581 RepID=A0ABX7GXB7_9GAMM|nr:MASE1 domain-containing protein [Dyella caseinilytica]
MALRLALLLFLPYRYWLAVLIADAVPNFLVVYPCLDQFGAMWVAWRAIPPIAFVMPIAWICRERFAIFPATNMVNIKALLACVLASALTYAASAMTAITLAYGKPGNLAPTPTLAIAYFIGFYFAMLAIVPWVLIVVFEYRAGQFREKLKHALESRLLLEGMTIMLPATALLAMVSHRHNSDDLQLTVMMMFLPVVWITLRHGWRATAFGSTIAIVCAVLVLPSESQNANLAVVQTELFLALSLTSLYALGARISSQSMEGRTHLDESQITREQARQSYLQGEQRMRHTAQSLEYVAGTLHVTFGRLLQNMRRIHPHIENESYYKQALTAQDQVYRLAESLHPLAWRERGLPAALQETIGQALGEAGIAYDCSIKGRGFTRMQSAVLAAAYRAACEAVVYVASRVACSSVRLTVRGGETNGSRWVFVAVEDATNESSVVRAIQAAADRRRLATKLGAMGFEMDELRSHVRLFDGELHQRNVQGRTRVTMLLHDPKQKEQRHERASASVRLWVR